jgi:tRNA (uracil-5-)-methyltransferase TRM9
MQVLAHGFAQGWGRPVLGAFDMRRSYDRYYETGLYDSRYPVPNRHMMDVIVTELGPAGGRVLDFGCGSGRYALPLSCRPGVEVFGYDVSAVAIEELRRGAEWTTLSGDPAPRLELLCGTMADLERRLQGDRGFDLVMLLFGVLGHIQGRGGRLIATVPNRARRFQAEQRRMRSHPGDALQPGDIHYWRGDDGEAIELYYHLYSPAEFCGELAEAGFALSRLEPESVLPERAVLNSRCCASLDTALRRIVPVALAYGFVAVAQPLHEADGGVGEAAPAAAA